MKINITQNGGILGVSKRHSDTVDALYKFPVNSLVSWYPWNTNYEWVLIDDEIMLTRTYKSKSERIYGRHYLNTYVWYNNSIEEDNTRIATFAEAMGIKNPFSTYVSADVSLGFETLGKQIDQFCARHTISLIESGTPYYRNSVGSLEKYALKDLSDPDARLFARLGEVYNMLSMMRKVVSRVGLT